MKPLAKVIVALLGVVAGVLPGASDAWSDEPFPGYKALCGIPIVVRATPSVSLATLNRSGQPVIQIDPVLERKSERLRRTFLIAHECAHHRMGHVSDAERRKRAMSRRVVRDHEMSADCWAAETLARAGDDRAVRIMMDRFYRAGLYSPGGGYPAGIQRATIIRDCAAAGRRTRASSGEIETR